jgi:hypothetical protein
VFSSSLQKPVMRSRGQGAQFRDIACAIQYTQRITALQSTPSRTPTTMKREVRSTTKFRPTKHVPFSHRKRVPQTLQFPTLEPFRDIFLVL